MHNLAQLEMFFLREYRHRSLSSSHVMHCYEPELQRELGSLINSPSDQRGLLVAIVALMNLAALDIAGLYAAAVRALKTIGALSFSNLLYTFLFGSVPLHELEIRKTLLKLNLAALHN